MSTVCLQRPVDGLKMTGKKVLGLLAKDIISSGFPNFRKPFWGFRGFLGAGNNPMVGMTVSVAVAVEESLK